jgi:hypothetical protein
MSLGWTPEWKRERNAPTHATAASEPRACERCGNTYDHPLLVRTSADDREHVFDCFECAIDRLAPHCDNCGCTVIGHGIQMQDRVFCCAHCARERGVRTAADRVDA